MGNFSSLPQQQNFPQADLSQADPYFQALNAERERAKQNLLMGSLQQAAMRDPALEANIQKFAAELGTTSEMVRTNYEKASSFLQVQRLKNAELERYAPQLYAQLNDPTWAAQAVTEWDKLAWFEQAGKGFEAGDLEVELGELMTGVMNGRVTYNSIKDRVNEIDRKLEELNVGDTFWGQTGKTVGQLWEWETLGNLAALVPVVGVPIAIASNARQAYEVEAGLAFHEYLKSGVDYQTAAANAHSVGLINAAIEAGGFMIAAKPFRAAAGNLLRNKSIRRQVTRLFGSALAGPVARKALATTAVRVVTQSATEVTEEILQENVTALFQRRAIHETQEKLSLRRPGTKIELPGGGEVRILKWGVVEVDPEVYYRVSGQTPDGDKTAPVTLQGDLAESLVRDINEVVLPAELTFSDESFWSDMWSLSQQTAVTAFKGTVLLSSTGPLLQHMSERKRVERAKYQRETYQSVVDKVKGVKLQQNNAGALALLFRRQWAKGSLKEVHVDRQDLQEALEASDVTLDELEEVVPGITQQVNASPDLQPTVVIDGATFFSELAETDLQRTMLDVIKPTATDMSMRESRDNAERIAKEAKELRKGMDAVNKVRGAVEDDATALATNLRDQAVAAGANRRQASDAVALFVVQQKELARQVSEKRGEVVTATQLLEEQLPEGMSIKDVIIGDENIKTKQGDLQALNFEQEANYEFAEADYRPEVVGWAREQFGDRVAPNGKLASENFARWFGDSKVVDAEGKPMVVFHGTHKDFKGGSFRSSASGIWFSKDPSQAEGGGGDAAVSVFPAYIKADNVYSLSSEELQEFRLATNPKKFMRGIIDRVQGEGFDAVAVDDYAVVAFDPNQIKSTNNEGTFSADEDGILRSQQGKPGDNYLKWTPPKTADGKIKGAPEWVKSMRDVTKLRKLLHTLVEEGKTGRYWYERSARSVLQIVQDDVADAEKLLQLIAIYSPLSDIWSNLIKATKAYEHWKSGKPPETLKAGFEKQNEKARAVLYENKPFEGRKTNSFYINLMHELFATRRQEVNALNLPADVTEKFDNAATIDLWMYRAFGYLNEQGGNDKQSGRYSFSENMTRRITAELNRDRPTGTAPFLPMQVQAMIWTAMKTRYEQQDVKDRTNARSKKEGLVYEKVVTGKDGKKKTVVAYGKTKAEQVQHLQNWRREAMKPKSDVIQAEAEIAGRDFSDDLERMAETVAWEAVPSTELNEPINNAPSQVVRVFTQEAQQIVLDPQGLDLLAQKLGVVFYHGKMSYGGYAGGVANNVLSSLVPLKPPGPDFSVEQVRLYTRALQYIFKQDAVPWYRLENTDITNNKVAKKRQQFRVINAKGSTLKLFDRQVDAQTFADTKTDAKVVGGPLAMSFMLQFKAGLTAEVRQGLMDGLAKVNTDMGFTQVSDNEVLVVNYRGEDNLPFMGTDEEITSALQKLANTETDLGIEKIKHGFAESEYGDVHNWGTERSGDSILQSHFAGSPDLQAWLRDRREAFETLLKQYDEAGIGDTLSALAAAGEAIGARRGTKRLNGPDGRHRSGSQTSVRYGRDRAGAASTSVLGVHYGKNPRHAYDANRYGGGKPGAEARRIAGHPVLSKRSYYYVDTGSGIIPEQGVGNELHSVNLDNLYDTTEDPLGIIADWKKKGSGDTNEFELAIVQAGFDGYYVPKAFGITYGNQETMGSAVIIGPEHKSIPVEYQGRYEGDFGMQAPPRAQPPQAAGQQQQAAGQQQSLADAARKAMGLKQQEDGTVLGTFNIETFKIVLGRKHTPATLTHEFSHLYFQQLIQLYRSGDLNEQQIADLETLVAMTGEFDGLLDYATAPFGDRHKKVHEQVSHKYEVYMRSGEAPTQALKNLFGRMAKWFQRTYSSVKRISENYASQFGEPLPALTDDVRMVFDRWFAASEEIDLRNRELMLGRLLLNEDLDPIDELFVKELIFDHELKAKEKLRTVFMKELKKLRRMRDREYRKFQRQHRTERKRVEQEEQAALLRESHLARMLHFLSSGELLNADGQVVDSFSPLKLAYAVNQLNDALSEQAEIRDDIRPRKEEAKSAREAALASLEKLPEILRELKKTSAAIRAEIKVQKKSGQPNPELLASNQAILANNEKIIADREADLIEQRKVRDDANGELRRIVNEEKAAAKEVDKAKKLVAVTKSQLGDEATARSRMFFTTDPRVPERYRTGNEKTALVLDIEGFARSNGFVSADQMFDALRVEMIGSEKAAKEFVSGDTVYTAEGDPAGVALQGMVDDRADRRMLAEMPHLADPEEMQFAIDNAMTTEALLRLRAAEINLLDKKAPAHRELLRTAKEVAKTVVAKLQASELFGRNNAIRGYLRAAQKAEIDAARARGDVTKVGALHRTALMQRALAQEAIKRREQLVKLQAKQEKQLRYTRNEKRETRLAQAYGGATVETARWILNLMGVEVGSGLAESNPDTWRPFTLLEADDPVRSELALAIDDAELIVSDQGLLQDQTVEQATESLLFVEGIMLRGKQLQTLSANDLQVTVKEFADELKRRVRDEKAPAKKVARTSWWGQKWAGIRKWRSQTQRLEQVFSAMDGDTYGMLSQLLFTPIRQAEDRVELKYADIASKLVELLKPVRDNVAKASELHDAITSGVDETGKPLLPDPGNNGEAFVFGAGKLDILGALLHAGNESNLERLLLGFGWVTRDENGEIDTSRWWEQVRQWEQAGIIKAEDWAFAQGVWNIYENELLPVTQKSFFEMFGREMETVAKGGTEMEARGLGGGYVPAAPEATTRSVKGESYAQENLLGFMRTIPAVFKGHTKGRVAQPNPDPLDINPLNQLVHFRQQAIFAIMGPVHRKAAHLLRNEEISELLERLNPGIYQNLIKHWLESAATLSSTMIDAKSNDLLSGLEFVNRFRSNGATAAMLGNTINSLQGTTGVLLARAKVPFKHMAQGMADGLREDGMTKAQIYGLSNFMSTRHRLGVGAFELQQQITELVKGGGPLGLAHVTRWLARNTYIIQEAIQKPVDLIVWRGGYDQALAQGLTETQAVAAADSAVRMTQSDTAVTSMSKAEKGNKFQKLFTQFTSWFLALGSLAVSPLRRATIQDRNLRDLDAGMTKRVARYTSAVLLSKEAIAGFLSLYIGELIMDALTEKDEDEPALDFAGSLYQTALAVPRAFGPMAGITSAIIATLSNADSYQQRMPAPSVASMLIRTARGVSKLYDKDGATAGDVTDLAEIVALMFGLPIQVVTQRLRRGFNILDEDDLDPNWRSVITGRR